MDTIFQVFHQAQSQYNGPLLASTLSPIPSTNDPTLLRRFYKDSNVFSLQGDVQKYIKARPSYLPNPEATAWIDVYVAYWKALGEILRAETGHHRDDWAVKVYEAWKDILTLLIRGYSPASGFGAWTMPCLYTVGKYLRVFAIKADEEQARKSDEEGGPVKMETDGLGDDLMGAGEKNKWLEDAARVINEVFRLCISDRAPLEESRKWGIYNTTNLLFKTYFKLNSIGLCKNILRALQATKADLPPIDNFPKSHIVTFKYYVGVIHFLDEEYARAEENLTEAFYMCHKGAHKNKELLLTYLIPTHLHTSQSVPSWDFLFKPGSQSNPLLDLFGDVRHAIRSGSLEDFTINLERYESQYVKRRIYLSVERARDLCLRNFLRRIWLLEGGKENTRVKVQTFAAGVRFSLCNTSHLPPERAVRKGRCDPHEWTEPKEDDMENDEVECLIAGLIYKVHSLKSPLSPFPLRQELNIISRHLYHEEREVDSDIQPSSQGLMKGYISREHGIVVLNRKGEAFPGTGV
ncbi:MAG: hypothetical protein Q9218_007912 [Villophora microphyllina]